MLVNWIRYLKYFNKQLTITAEIKKHKEYKNNIYCDAKYTMQ